MCYTMAIYYYFKLRAAMQKIIQSYLKGLEAGDPHAIVVLFADEGTVHSPLYGDVKAQEFYKSLFEDTASSAITLLHTFESDDSPLVFAAHFLYRWTMKDGTITTFECVDIFSCNSAMKITELRIIYDTAKTRPAFESLVADRE